MTRSRGGGRRRRPARPKAARPAAARKGKGKGGGKNSGRRVRLAWHEDNESGYEVELQLREHGVGTQDRKWSDDENGRILSVTVAAGQEPWAQEIIYVMAKRAPAIDPERLTKAVRRRMKTKADYVPKRRFQKRAVRSGGGLINRGSEMLLDTMGLWFGGATIFNSASDRRRKYNDKIE